VLKAKSKTQKIKQNTANAANPCHQSCQTSHQGKFLTKEMDLLTNTGNQDVPCGLQTHANTLQRRPLQQVVDAKGSLYL